MKRSYEKANKAEERLFWDTCFVETFSEEPAAWGESLHEKGEGETFPCRLTEKAEVCGTDGLLTQTEKTVILLYPAEKEIAAGNAVRIRRENGAERRYIAAGESRIFLTHRAVGLRRDETATEEIRRAVIQAIAAGFSCPYMGRGCRRGRKSPALRWN
ncbi:MAG: hypothetical protein ACLUD9_05080 [Anaerotignum faecicola]